MILNSYCYIYVISYIEKLTNKLLLRKEKYRTINEYVAIHIRQLLIICQWIV